MSDKVTREIEFRAKSSDEGSGVLEGIGNMIGEIDSYWTVSHPRSKAFQAEAIQKFITNGMMLPGHSTREGQIGMIGDASVNGREFNVKCMYHSDDESQRYRTIAKERVDNGKTVGLSIGFTVSQYEWFESGKKCLEALGQRNEDLALFNVAQIEAWEEDLWLMYIDQVYEVSQVCFQSNEPSVATAVRSGEPIEVEYRVVDGKLEIDEATEARLKSVGIIMRETDSGDQKPEVDEEAERQHENQQREIERLLAR
jgi:hypothetical protein